VSSERPLLSYSKNDLIMASSAIDKMFEIYTFYENRTEICIFFENRSEIYILFENMTEIYILFENRFEIYICTRDYPGLLRQSLKFRETASLTLKKCSFQAHNFLLCLGLYLRGEDMYQKAKTCGPSK